MLTGDTLDFVLADDLPIAEPRRLGTASAPPRPTPCHTKPGDVAAQHADAYIVGHYHTIIQLLCRGHGMKRQRLACIFLGCPKTA